MSTRSEPARRITRDESDSIFAQALADREGPRADVFAEYTNVAAGGRRLRARFHVDDDAYVLIGHVDADGIVRIVFPNDPKDNGFVRGQKSYETNEFFAGFTDAYRFRAQTAGYRTFRPDAYDGGFGYVFIVASWRPMHFEQFAGPNGWDSFEMSDLREMNDPRPAIYELAALLAGENREAYTVKFARYSNTMNLDPSFRNAAYGAQMCNGVGYNRYYGFGWLPIDLSPMNPLYTYGNSFTYRGTPYYYSSAGDCYYTGGYGYGYRRQPFVISQTPPAPLGGVRSRGRVMAAEDSPRNPADPAKPVGGKIGPVRAQDVGNSENGVPTRFSPQYRDRGLITNDDPSATPPTRSPRIQLGQIENPRPSIQQMTERRTQNQNDGSGWSPTPRARASNGDNNGGSSSSRPQQPQSRGRDVSGGSDEGRTFTRPTPQDSPRSVPAQRAEPAPRVETPRSSPPAAPPPRSEPPATGSSTRPITP